LRSSFGNVVMKVVLVNGVDGKIADLCISMLILYDELCEVGLVGYIAIEYPKIVLYLKDVRIDRMILL
jgi:hypothetical protein